MKNFLIFAIASGVLVGAGSMFYYYVVLPQQDIKAIRNVIAPDLEQRKIQQQQQAQREAQSTKALNDYSDCLLSMLNNPKKEAWLSEQCPSNTMEDLLKQMDCRGKAIQSSYYIKQFECPYPF